MYNAHVQVRTCSFSHTHSPPHTNIHVRAQSHTCEVGGDKEKRGAKEREAQAQTSLSLDECDGPGGIAGRPHSYSRWEAIQQLAI